MRSDAAQVIALSKSRGRLLSPGSAGSTTSSIADAVTPIATAVRCPTASTDTTALLANQAVIVYDERTAL